MKKTLQQLMLIGLYLTLPLFAFAHGGEEDGDAETAIQTVQAVADPGQRMYVAVGVGVFLFALALWFFYSKRSK